MKTAIKKFIAKWLFNKIWSIKKLIAWICPESTNSELRIGYYKGKVRLALYYPFVDKTGESASMTAYNWEKTIDTVNNLIAFDKNGDGTHE